MNSHAAGRLIAAPLMFVGVRWATEYLRHGHPALLAAVVWLGFSMLAITAVLVVAGYFVMLFPRLGARLFPWAAAVQHRTRGTP